MKRFTEKELQAFISRADTREKVEIAIEFIRKLDIDNDLYDNLMTGLAYISRELRYQERFPESDTYSPSAPWGAAGMNARDFVR